jgi:hypothetical protein
MDYQNLIVLSRRRKGEKIVVYQKRVTATEQMFEYNKSGI